MDKIKRNVHHIQALDSDRIEKNTDFVRAEGFNTLRSNVRICLKKDDHNKVVITSPLSGDGKSTCSCNLAISFANTGKSVVIIDCDMRKPVIHKTFGLSNKNGLADILSRLSSLQDCIQKTKYNNLCIISAGTNVPNPSELLSSNEMKQLINNLEEQYAYIILDCPPINILSDAVPLFDLVDGLVLVARYGKTTHMDLQKAFSIIEFAKANLFGIFYYDKPIQKNKRYGYNYKYSNNYYGNYIKEESNSK